MNGSTAKTIESVVPGFSRVPLRWQKPSSAAYFFAVRIGGLTARGTFRSGDLTDHHKVSRLFQSCQPRSDGIPDEEVTPDSTLLNAKFLEGTRFTWFHPSPTY